MNNITTCDDSDVVLRGATNIFFKLIMLDFLVCCVLVMRVRVRVRVGPVRKNTSVSSYHPLVSIQRRLNNE